MRIKKTFQGEIPENKIVNMQSDSQTDAYSADFVNKKIKTSKITSNTDTYSCTFLNGLLYPSTSGPDSNGWYKREYPDRTVYWKNFNFQKSYTGNFWGGVYWQYLPVGVSGFNANTMMFCGSARCDDTAVLHNVSIGNGDTSVTIDANNKYGGDVNNVYSKVNMILTVYK